MKIFLIVSCLLATAAAISTEALNKYSEAFKDPIAKCGKQYGFTDMNLQEIYEKEERDGGSCFHACLMKSLGVLTYSGIDARKMGKSIERVFPDQPEVAAETLQTAIQCIPEVAYILDECEMAYHYFKCYLLTH